MKDKNPDNYYENFYVNDDGEIVKGIEKIATIPVSDIDGNFLGEINTLSCATYQDMHFRVFEFLWEYHLQRNYPVESVAAYLRGLFPGFPNSAEIFLSSKKGEVPPQSPRPGGS